MRKSGPFKVIQEGNTSVPICRLTTRTGTVYSEIWYDGRQRKREAFARLEKATEFADKQTKALARLDWSEIGEHIDIKAAKAKTRARRLVPILDPLRAWLVHTATIPGPCARSPRSIPSSGSLPRRPGSSGSGLDSAIRSEPTEWRW